MKLLSGLIIVVSLWSSVALGKKVLAPIPEGCFDEESYCSSSTWERARDENNKKFLKVFIKFHAQLSMDEYSSVEELEEIFTDFESWPEYVRNSRNVKYESSVTLPATIMEDGTSMMHNVARYELRRPLGWEKVVEKSDYVKVESFEGAEVSYKFTLDKNFKETLGVKDKVGYIHVVMDEENNVFKILINLEIRPAINILPKVTSQVITRGLVDIFKGMFDLEDE